MTHPVRRSTSWRVQAADAAAAVYPEVVNPQQQQPEVAGLPSPVEVMALCSGSEAATAATAVELTGASDPLRLAAWHSVDARARHLVVHLEITNRLVNEVKGVFAR